MWLPTTAVYTCCVKIIYLLGIRKYKVNKGHLHFDILLSLQKTGTNWNNYYNGQRKNRAFGLEININKANLTVVDRGNTHKLEHPNNFPDIDRTDGFTYLGAISL